jgi:hypothetical protein
MSTPAEIVARLEAKKELFVRQLDQAGRHWFTTRMVDHAKSEPDVEFSARFVLNIAKDMVTDRLDKTRKSLLDDLKRPRRNEIRARIIYGLLGNFPGVFLDNYGDDLLDFIVERRYRSIQRMLSYINPNDGRAIIGYPSGGMLSSQVNKQSRDFWEGVDAERKFYPFMLTTKGKASPKEAIESLFKKNKNKADRTLIDCPAAAMLTHLDALLAAKDPDKLMENLVADGPLVYILIDHPYGSLYIFGTGYTGGFGGWLNQPAPAGDDIDLKMFHGLSAIPPNSLVLMDGSGAESITISKVTPRKVANALTGGELTNGNICIEANPLNETTVQVKNLSREFSVGSHLSLRFVDWFSVVGDDRPDKALFERSFISKDDLQVGDHIYLANHSIHMTRIGSTPWNGEHAFVLNPWHSNPNQIQITGHGINEQTVLQLSQQMLNEINAFLDITRVIVDKWLAIPDSRTPDWSQAGVATPTWKAFLARFLLEGNPVPFDGTMRVFNIPGITYSRGGKSRTYPGSWVMDLEGTSGNRSFNRRELLLYDYDPRAKSAKPWKNPWPSVNPVAVWRDPQLVSLSTEPKRQCVVSYTDLNVGMGLVMPLYYPIDPHKGKPVRLTFDDIKRSVFFGLDDGRIFVVRPRVTDDVGYRLHLRNIGAIA